MTAKFNHVSGLELAAHVEKEQSIQEQQPNLVDRWMPRFAEQQQARRFFVYVTLFLALYLAFYLAPFAISLFYAGLCVWALMGPKQALQAITLAVFIRYLNPGLFSLPFEIGPLSWLILLLAFVRNVFLFKSDVLSKLVPLCVFAVVVMTLTFTTSHYPMVSIMKLLSFTLGATTVLICCEALKANEIRQLWVWILALFAVVMCLSLATFLIPAAAYHRGAGFQGLLNHPQSLGALIAPFVSWLLARVFFQKKSLLSIPVFISVILIGISIFSETRTAMVAVALGLSASFIAFTLSHRRYKRFGNLGKTLAKAGTVACLLVVAVLAYKPAQDVIMSYVFKRESQNLEEALSSRSAGIASQWQNFLAKPVAGWGFGIYPGEDFAKEVHTFMGIPISAPVEKGFIPTALLEEVGVVGALCFFYLIAALCRYTVRAVDIRWSAVFFSCLFVNLGEMVFFSAGGIGIFYWVLMGLSTCAYKLNAVEKK